MRRWRWVWIPSLAVLLLCAAWWFYSCVQNRREEAAFREQLRLARLEGIPTTAAEFAALIRPCRPENNAAPYYRRLGSVSSMSVGTALNYNLLFKPSPSNLRKAQAFLDTNRRTLELIDLATKEPHCWFNRDWAKGYAVTFPEYAPMKEAAKLVGFRGALEVAEGRPELALEDIRDIQVMAQHLSEEPDIIARLSADALRIIAMRDLAYWSYLHRDVPAYPEALKLAIDNFTAPDERAEHAGELFCLIELLDQVKTPEGLKEMGMKPEDAQLDLQTELSAAAFSHGKGRADIVNAVREMWAAYALPPSKRRDVMEKSGADLTAAMWSEPVAAGWLTSVSGSADLASVWKDIHRKIWAICRAQYLAAYRALSSAKIPSLIKTSDLVSPFDGKPLSYHFDGKQMVIKVSKPDGEDQDWSNSLVLRIPPDPPKAAARLAS